MKFKSLLALPLSLLLVGCSANVSRWKIVNQVDDFNKITNDTIAGTDYVSALNNKVDTKARLTYSCGTSFTLEFDEETYLNLKDPDYSDLSKPLEFNYFTFRFYNEGEYGKTILFTRSMYDDERGYFIIIYNPSFYESEDDMHKEKFIEDFNKFIKEYDYITVGVPWPEVRTVDYIWSLQSASKVIDDYCAGK